VKTRFLKVCFLKCNLYRYTWAELANAAAQPLPDEDDELADA
jgi:hypothetical protein